MGQSVISIDLFPQVNLGELDKQLQVLLDAVHKKQTKNALEGFVLPALVPVLLHLSDVDGERPAHSLTRDERSSLVRLLKDLRVTVTGLLGLDKAIITSGRRRPLGSGLQIHAFASFIRISILSGIS
jgi:predicted flavoprotein YhiN